jgi:replicative DNA helicase
LSSPTSEPAATTPDQPMPRLVRLADALADFNADAAAAHEARMTGKPRGAVSGLSTLDRELSGAFAPGVHALHGNTGSGKTALALQIAAHAQCPALFVSCEMTPAELLRRLTANLTSTYLGRLKSGEMRPDDAELLAMKAIASAPGLAFVEATQAAAPPEYLRECAHIVRGESKHLLIVIDSLHTWAQTLSVGIGGASEYEALNEAIRALQMLAAQLACPILMICERNRDSMKGGGVNAGAGTRKIEYQGETVLDLERKTEMPDGAGEVDISLKLAKNRHGAAGKAIALKFNGALQRFSEPEAER